MSLNKCFIYFITTNNWCHKWQELITIILIINILFSVLLSCQLREFIVKYFLCIWTRAGTDTIPFNVWRPLPMSFGIQPLLLLVDDVFPWFLYAVMTLKTAALHTANEVAVWFDAPAKRAPKMCPLWKSEKTPILQYFHMNCYKTQSVMHWHWH